jgi:hypothetical protein
MAIMTAHPRKVRAKMLSRYYASKEKAHKPEAQVKGQAVMFFQAGVL